MEGLWEWSEWIPAITSSGVLAVLSIIGVHVFKPWFEKALSHRFDSDLEKIRSDLREKGDQISAVRSGALSALTSRHGALDQRRLEAVETLWKATIAQSRFKFALGMVNSLNVDAALARSSAQTDDGRKLREFGEAIWTASSIEEITKQQPASPDTERLFVPPMAWAAFAAYRSVMAHAIIIIATIKTGMGKSILKGMEDVNKAVKIALPHATELIDKFPETAVFRLAEQLEEKVFEELTKSFSDTQGDLRNVERAARIISYAQELPTPATIAEAEKIDKKVKELDIGDNPAAAAAEPIFP